MQLSSHHWRLSEATQPQQIKEALAKRFALGNPANQSLKYALVDNFEHTLWHSGNLLFQAKQHFILQGANTQLEQVCDHKNPRFWWDFPPGELQNLLAQQLGFWSLAPIADISIQKSLVNVLNRDEKTVLRLVFTHHQQADEQQSVQYASLLPLRGYSKEYARAFSLCEALLDSPCPAPDLKYLARQQNLSLKPKNTKKYGIQPDIPSEKTLYAMLRHITYRTQSYIPGIIKDIDTEFLHQYRVHLRQARSLVNLTKQALPENVYLDLKTKLAELAAPTGPLRDLDVFLLNQADYTNLLPQHFDEGVNELFKVFQQEREQAFKKVKQFLSAKHSKLLFSEIETLVTAEPFYASEASQQAIIDLAKKRILKRYQKVRTLGEKIQHDTPDDEVHELRIECKKLRYLMEFFSELFPKKRISWLIKALKELQSILGNFNDYSVQKEFIANYAQNTRSPKLIAAASGFVAVLHQKQIEEKALVMNAFAGFSQQSIATEFEQLFSQ